MAHAASEVDEGILTNLMTRTDPDQFHKEQDHRCSLLHQELPCLQRQPQRKYIRTSMNYIQHTSASSCEGVLKCQKFGGGRKKKGGRSPAVVSL